MSADHGGIRATQDKERAQEVPDHGHPCQEILPESKEVVPLGAARESPYIKTELQEPHPEGASQEDRAQRAWSWGRLSQGSKEKALFLPGGALPSPQIPVLSHEGRTRDRQMAAALLTAWSQMPVTFEDVALYLSREDVDGKQPVARDWGEPKTTGSRAPRRREVWKQPCPTLASQRNPAKGRQEPLKVARRAWSLMVMPARRPTNASSVARALAGTPTW
uniref:Zinc finger protein 205 n=1 Tax=Molossus molossus TaxID=27622 RepID=A0A7J8J583_MOLMO|nr:zinc finger protein 205 [Molossus molossus]